MMAASRPIFTVDPLAVKRDKTSNAISFVIHVVAITLILTLAMKARTSHAAATTIVTPCGLQTYRSSDYLAGGKGARRRRRRRRA
jgi:hypothetical protein